MRPDRWFVPAGYCPAQSVVIALIAAAALTLVDWPVQAQQSAPKDLAPKAAPAAPAKPKAAQPKAPAAQPKEVQAPAVPPQQAASPPAQPPQLSYSPWTKYCTPDAQAKQVCITAKDGRLEDGRIVVSAALIEPEGEQRKILKVMLLPLGLQISSGTRVVVDQGQPMTGPYVICFNNGCMADYEASGELIGKLKKGQGLVVQGINGQGQAISLVLPLSDFAKAYDGPPTDPKVFEEQQKKLQEELQRRADEARKKLESQQGAAVPGAPVR